MNGSHRHRRSVYLDEAQWAALAEVAKAEDRSVNGVVRRFVAEGLRRPTALIELPPDASPLKVRQVREVIEDRDAEIARLKRELAARPVSSTTLPPPNTSLMGTIAHGDRFGAPRPAPKTPRKTR